MPATPEQLERRISRLERDVQAARGISSVSVNMHGARIVKTTATREASGGWTGMIGRAKSRSKPGPVATSRVTRGGVLTF